MEENAQWLNLVNFEIYHWQIKNNLFKHKHIFT